MKKGFMFLLFLFAIIMVGCSTEKEVVLDSIAISVYKYEDREVISVPLEEKTLSIEAIVSWNKNQTSKAAYKVTWQIEEETSNEISAIDPAHTKGKIVNMRLNETGVFTIVATANSKNQVFTKLEIEVFNLNDSDPEEVAFNSSVNGRNNLSMLYFNGSSNFGYFDLPTENAKRNKKIYF